MAEHALTTSEFINGARQSSSHATEGAAQQQAQDGNHVLGGPPGARLNDKEQRVHHHYSRGPAQHCHNMQQHALHVMESSSPVCHHSIAWCHIMSQLVTLDKVQFGSNLCRLTNTHYLLTAASMTNLLAAQRGAGIWVPTQISPCMRRQGVRRPPRMPQAPSLRCTG